MHTAKPVRVLNLAAGRVYMPPATPVFCGRPTSAKRRRTTVNRARGLFRFSGALFSRPLPYVRYTVRRGSSAEMQVMRLPLRVINRVLCVHSSFRVVSFVICVHVASCLKARLHVARRRATTRCHVAANYFSQRNSRSVLCWDAWQVLILTKSSKCREAIIMQPVNGWIP